MDFVDAARFAAELLASPVSWLGLAFSIGLIHAFDADHVMALSVLATRQRGVRRAMGEGLRWSAGHGLVVLVAGLAALLLGLHLPPDLAALAERGVGLVMIVLGASLFVRLLRRGMHLHFHAHDGLPPHAHWHRHVDAEEHPDPQAHRHAHAASLVGALHGLAGAAPILALLPASARSPALGIAYLVVFGLGVALSMALVSGIFGHAVERCSARAQAKALMVLRAASGVGSIGLGAWLTFAG